MEVCSGIQVYDVNIIEMGWILEEEEEEKREERERAAERERDREQT